MKKALPSIRASASPSPPGSTALVQTLIPRDVAAWLKTKAKREGISVAAWLRRLLMQTKEAAR